MTEVIVIGSCAEGEENFVVVHHTPKAVRNAVETWVNHQAGRSLWRRELLAESSPVKVGE